MADKFKKIWRLNPITGYWEYQRSCMMGGAELWLKIYQEDEPDIKFKIGVNKPRS